MGKALLACFPHCIYGAKLNQKESCFQDPCKQASLSAWFFLAFMSSSRRKASLLVAQLLLATRRTGLLPLVYLAPPGRKPLWAASLSSSLVVMPQYQLVSAHSKR